MRHTVVVDLGFGDAGKGTVVDWLASPAAAAVGLADPPVAVVRFNGGAQAGHNVVAPDGRHHTFAQFGSATLHGIPTVLSQYMLVQPVALAAEATALRRLGVPDPFGMLSVDIDALLTTPYHAAVNRARERARGDAAHGSCGLGIGETVGYTLAHPGDAPRVGDCLDPPRLKRRLRCLRDWADTRLAELSPAGPGHRPPSISDLAEVYAAFAARVNLIDSTAVGRLARSGRLVFEGAQGVLLDESYGFHPHTTWSQTTFANALRLLAGAGVDVEDPRQVLRIGVTRTYATRHGAGPFVSEDPRLQPLLTECHNGAGRWQGAFRVGHLDLVGLRYAVDCCGGIDAIAVTHLDLAEALARTSPGALQVAFAWDIPATDRRLPRLPVTRGPQPGHQGRLTALARRAEPVLMEAPTDWADLLTRELGAPTLVESRGPTWADKGRGILTPLVA